jgi:hypothetical protein
MRNVPFAVGQVWKDRSGSLWEIVSLASPGNWFYFTAAHCSSDAKARFNANGYYFNDGNTSSNDLVECVSHNVTPSIKKLLNFWEAREAAKQGKTVKCWKGKWCNTYPAETFFSISNWTTDKIDGKWEIVEEPKTFTQYVVPHKDGLSTAFDTEEKAKKYQSICNGLSIIVITYDENGKLISAGNV